jgi:uncharacterized protein
MSMNEEFRNVLGGPLKACSYAPLTGFNRTGCCEPCDADPGMHIVCVRVTAQFLEFSQQRGNDLTTPQPTQRFAGLKPGDRWCLCAARWVEAWRAGCAPLVVLEATSELVLGLIPQGVLYEYAWEKRSRDDKSPAAPGDPAR